MADKTLQSVLVEAEYELWALEQYLLVLEDQLQQLVTFTPARALRSLHERGLASDASAVLVIEQQTAELVNHVYPRFFRSPSLLVLCAAFEAILLNVADGIRQSNGLALRLSDIRGDSFTQRADKYFRHVLAHPLDTSAPGWSRMEAIYQIRHCLVHANGRVSSMRQGQSNELAHTVATLSGVSTDQGYIVLESKFIQDTTPLVTGWLRSLLARSRALL